MKKTEMIEFAQGRVKTAKAEIADFATKLVEKPEHTLTWGTVIFSRTADLTVWEQILVYAKSDCSLEDVVGMLEDYVVGGAASPSYSTNYAKNHLEQETLRAYAETYKEFKRRLRYEQRQSAEGAKSPSK